MPTGTLLLLEFGGLLAGIGYVFGLVAFWSSPAWTRQDKLIGTLILPGGILFPLAFNLYVGPAGAPGKVFGVLLFLMVPAMLAWLAARARMRTATG